MALTIDPRYYDAAIFDHDGVVATSTRVRVGGIQTPARALTTAASPWPTTCDTYYQVSGDVDYLVDYGAEMLIEIARFWASLANFDAARQRYVIRGVIGPDEFHSGYPGRAYDGIDNIDYYRSRTSHGSTLSAVVHAWVLARGDRDQALKYFQQVLLSDFADIQGGTTFEGIHLAAMAGSVDLLQRCFTGLEFRADRVVLNPLWPQQLGKLAFRLRYRGHRLHLEVSGREAKISSDSEQANAIDIEYRGQVRSLMPGCTIEFA
jgi:trehalose/maltose hydrolase-like predicted phosphorylase